MEKILGSSPQAQSLQKLLEQASLTDVPVLILGERGSGRQFAARALHTGGSRKGSFEVLVCRGLNDAILVSELAARLERADGGTLFLDDINELGTAAQGQLLSQLQSNGRGGVRIVGASSRSLEESVESGYFSRELYQQLLGIRIVLTPLRERRVDIPVFAQEFLRDLDRRQSRPARSIQSVALKRLINYDWPGNIRELKDAVERAAVMRQDMLRLEDFDFLVPTGQEISLETMIPGAAIRDIEREAILRTLDYVGGSTIAAARILKMSVRKIQYKLKQYRKNGEAAPEVKRKGAGTSTS
jgi:DNA-binding NtrC family response regulator